ncbi:MAG: MAPEG family protein [Oceanospirillaceae bacterium]
MIYPMFALCLLTILVGFFTVKARFASVKKGELAAEYFELMQGEDVPREVIKTTRCLNNLFEVPILFYIACTLYLVLEVESIAGWAIAWAFVIFRCAQAYIHITYNHTRHRMVAFGCSVLCALLLWVNLVVVEI